VLEAFGVDRTKGLSDSQVLLLTSDPSALRNFGLGWTDLVSGFCLGRWSSMPCSTAKTVRSFVLPYAFLNK
jgi:hypothetical protein